MSSQQETISSICDHHGGALCEIEEAGDGFLKVTVYGEGVTVDDEGVVSEPYNVQQRYLVGSEGGYTLLNDQ